MVLQGARATAESQQLPHEVLTAQQAMQRFPGETAQLRVPQTPPSSAEAAGKSSSICGLNLGLSVNP
jgi:hypothetical protein